MFCFKNIIKSIDPLSEPIIWITILNLIFHVIKGCLGFPGNISIQVFLDKLKREIDVDLV